MTSTIGSVPSTEGGGATAEPEREPRTAEAAEATGPSSSFQLVLNGEPVAVEGVEPQTSLLTWLRATGRTGAKEGCAEGDCGACTVTMLTTDAHGRPTFRADDRQSTSRIVGAASRMRQRTVSPSALRRGPSVWVSARRASARSASTRRFAQDNAFPRPLVARWFRFRSKPKPACRRHPAVQRRAPREYSPGYDYADNQS